MADAFSPFTLPLRREGDAAILDKAGKTFLVIDPDRDLEDDEATRIADFVFARLSAAPAPEGGAVKDWDAIRSHPCYDEHQPGCDCAALATREEAPAEAGEIGDALFRALRSYKLTNMACEDDPSIGYPLVDLMSNDGTDISTGEEEMRVLADHLSEALRAQPPVATSIFVARAKHFLDLAEKAEGDALDGDEGCVWPVEALRAAYADLTAQPAREDAQPVASARLAKAMWGVDLVPAANPAPDALRVAVEKIEECQKIIDMNAEKAEAIIRGRYGRRMIAGVRLRMSMSIDRLLAEALAALQAEQGAK